MLNILKEKLESSFPGAKIILTDQGGGDHLHLFIEAPQFKNLSRVKQHQMVYKVLAEEMKGPIHALAIDSKELT